MILECDIGNTRCKWRRLSEAGEILSRGTFNHADGLVALPSLELVDRVRVACVASDKVKQQFNTVFDAAGVCVEYASSTQPVSGMVNAYGKQAAMLGVDRWLGLVAAYKKQQAAVLVIDAGTALKADLVAGDGRHLGGYIIPGVDLMKSSLMMGTGKVRFEHGKHLSGVRFGCSTADAVSAGILASQLGAVNVAIAEAKRQIPAGFAILVTGGGCVSIKEWLPDEVVEVPELVLDGLRWLLP